MGKTTKEPVQAPEQQEMLRQALAQLGALKRLQAESNARIGEGITGLEQRIRTLLASGNAESMETFDWQQQCAEAIATLQKFGFFESVTFPTPEAVQGAFSTEKQEAISRFRKPTLLLVPKVSFGELVRAIDASGLARNKTYVNEDVFGSLSKSTGKKEKATAVQPVVIEGMQEMDVAPGDDRSDTLGKRIAAVRENRGVHMSGADRDQYAMLQMRALKNGQTVDQKTWTILDGDKALEGNTVPYGDWFGDRVNFGYDPADYVDERARFRSSVGGGVLEC